MTQDDFQTIAHGLLSRREAVLRAARQLQPSPLANLDLVGINRVTLNLGIGKRDGGDRTPKSSPRDHGRHARSVPVRSPHPAQR